MEAETPAGPSCKLVIGVAIDRSIGRTPERSRAAGSQGRLGREEVEVDGGGGGLWWRLSRLACHDNILMGLIN